MFEVCDSFIKIFESNMFSFDNRLVLYFRQRRTKASSEGHGMTITPNRMTWLDSFSYCSLASEDSIPYLTAGEYRGWVGGIYLNSQWMFHKGCHSNSGSMNSNGVYDIKRLTPIHCSEKCKMNEYFAMKYNWCLCLHSLYNLEEVDSSKCTYKCAGSNNNVCGERSHFTVYQHFIGKSKPKPDVDQRFACSVIMPRNGTFVLKAVDCSLKYWTACVIYGVTRQMGFTDSYQSADSRCSSSNGSILSTIDNLDKLEDGREYWSNIFRSRFLKWTTKATFDEVCYNDITTIARNQPESEQKPEPTPKSLSTETVHKTSFVSTTSDDKSTNSVKTSSPKGTSTDFVSKNSEYTDLFTQDQSFSLTRSVLVSSSLSSLSDTTVIKRTDHHTLTVPLDNENRTVINEPTNTDSFYITTVSIAGVAFFGMVMVALLLIVRTRRKKARSEVNVGRQPNTKNEKRSYEKPWDELKVLNIGISNSKIYDKTKNQTSPECQIYDVAKDHYHHLDFDIGSKQCKFVEAEYDVSMQTVTLSMPEIHNSLSNNSMPNFVFQREERRRSSSDFSQCPLSYKEAANENVAYCDTAIVQTKLLYDLPNQSEG
ncbi:Hypothetical predicted protein [Mytilus galloprovincialis]|uniref:WSC domain-containing protein n=1 Tax=Mytilus galloprovincialis TaxID=29158 RepID=A0A8B6G4Q3_MYTGA|nr:Hypothetical predicted protein [Mytilus galloprovincialis]